MANKVQEQTDVMVEAKGKLELFFDKWGNKIFNKRTRGSYNDARARKSIYPETK